MRRALAASALILGLLGADAAVACNAGAYHRAAHAGRHAGPAPWVIGDSTMIFATPVMGRLGMEADAHGCRQFSQGVAMIATRRPRSQVPSAVVLALGANGAVSRGAIARARFVMGRKRFLVMVTPKNSGSTIAAMRAADRAHPDRVLTLDWAAYSAGRGSSWFGGDNLHVNYTGARVYAHFVRDGLDPFFGPPRRGRKLNLPEGADDRRVRSCGQIRAYGRQTQVFLTRGTLSCRYARKLMRRPRLHEPRRWRFYDWRAVGRGPWTDVLARYDRASVIAGITR